MPELTGVETINYRAEIDGLRTIAVLSVIVYHARISVAGWQLLPGGYLGVDIFFVISGYLITSILLTEFDRTGRLSLANFYERRARRLLPALLLVMLASLPFAAHLLASDQLTDFANSLIFSLFFASNFYWDFSLQQYDADSALLRPFLHTWSLAVEEQYYIIFPLMLFAACKWCPRYLSALLLAVMILSLMFAEWMTAVNASFSFYMMPTRLWELLCGSLLALALLRMPVKHSMSLAHRAMPGLGLVMIVASLILFDFEIQHPGLITLIPVLGTAFIIGFGHGNEWVSRSLSNPAMVYIGLLSYSLYLWHYPIFAFGRIVDPSPDLIQKTFWLTLTLALSVLSYHFVEKPFRSRRIPTTIALTCMAATAFIVLFFSFSWILKDGSVAADDYLESLILSETRGHVHKGDFNCHSGLERHRFDISESCVFETFPGQPTLVLVGDSHAAAIAVSLYQLARRNRLNFVQITQVGCPHLAIDDLSADSQNCFARMKMLDTILGELERPTIIYSARLPIYLEPEGKSSVEGGATENFIVRNTRRNLTNAHPDDPSIAVIDTLQPWVRKGYGLVLVYPVPDQGFGVFRTLRSHTPPIKSADDLPALYSSYDSYKDRARLSIDALNSVVGPRIARIYPDKVFCSEQTNKCMATESDRLYFATDSHVSALGSDLIVREIARELDLKVPASFRE